MQSNYLKILIIAAVLSLSCTTKVSEWFLLNAAPDNYLLVYYHRDAIPETVARQNKELETRFKTANVQFRTMLKEEVEKPYYALFYKNKLFSEYTDFNSLRGIEFSPVRAKIASELMSGKLCVMLYLKSGNREKDESGLQTLKKTVTASPFANIISIVELDRNSVEESHLVSMLLQVESDLKSIHEPMLFGIFGRFRALEPLLAKGISEENINLLIGFLTADCSCLIKDNLPGISILYKADWENPRPAMVNEILDDNPYLIH